jgi:hypothetical protein
MGYYTELKFDAKLKQDTPENVLNILKRVINERDLGHDKVLFNTKDVFKPELDHPFFKCERWYMLFLSTNWNEEMRGGKFYEEKGRWIISLHTEFKDQDNEIDNFFEWINPFIAGRKKKQYVGYYRGEEEKRQTNLYVER